MSTLPSIPDEVTRLVPLPLANYPTAPALNAAINNVAQQQYITGFHLQTSFIACEVLNLIFVRE